MQEHFISYKSSQIQYFIFGSGPKLFYCFHGYGENADSFSFLENIAGSDYTFIALNLPFHGNTLWNDGLNFALQDLVDILKETIAGKDFQAIGLLGYSMGGRVCLQLLELMPEKISNVILIAPDGLCKNYWYFFSTQTFIGNKLFNYAMKHTGWLFASMKMFNKLGLLNTSIYKIAHYYLDEESERQLLYNRWTIMRKFKPAIPLIKEIIRANKIQVKLLFGKYDKIIPADNGKVLQQGIEEYVMLNIAEAGHQLLREKHSELIKSLLA